MMNKLFSICLLLSVIILGSCSNDINTNAPEKEIMVIYGLLNPNDTANHIRVHKAFLTNGQSAIEYAKTIDDKFFDSLEVTIDEFDVASTPILLNTYKLFKNTSFQKDSGIFTAESNTVFTLNQKLNQNNLYRVTVKNKITGNTAVGETRMVQDPNPTSPSRNTTLLVINPDNIFPVLWEPSQNARIYDVVLRFYWNEHDSASKQIIDSTLFIDWNLAENKEVTSGRLRSNVPGGNFYSFIATRLPYQIGKYRVPKKIEIFYWSADEQFYLYRKVNTPVIGIVQTKPEYTNVSNGNFGLIASRNKFTLENIGISDIFTDLLRTNRETAPLKFRRP